MQIENDIKYFTKSYNQKEDDLNILRKLMQHNNQLLKDNAKNQ